MLRKWCWFYGLCLLVISSLACADSSGAAPTITSSAVANHTDLSINLLSQLFGTVGNSLAGTSGQMLGKLFYELNVGMLIVAGLWMTYTVVTLVFGAATEGGFMNSRNNVVLAFLKIAIGIGALIPSPSTGYSPVQDIMMKVVVKSVEFADMTWSHGLDYLAQGGAVWAPPVASAGGGLDISSFSQLYAKAIVPTFNAEVCMFKNSIAATANSNSNTNGMGVPQELSPIDNDANMSFDFPSGQDPSKAQGCGSFQWGMIPGASSGNQKTTEGEYAYEAAYKVVYGLLPSAKNYACSISPSVENSICSGLSKQIDFDGDSEELFNNTLAYVNEIMPMLRVGSGAAAAQTAAFLQAAQTQGWILAGRYSWDLSHLKDQVIQSSTLATYVPPDFKPTDSSQADAAQSNNALGSSTDPMMILLQMVQSKYNNYAGLSNTGSGGGGSGAYDTGSNAKWIDPFIASLISDIMDLNAQFGSNMGSDPIYFLHRVGMMCIYIAGDIWIELAMVAGLVMVVGIICSGGSVDLDKPIGAAVDWFKPLAMAVAGVFIISGGMLAFYVPVYAFFIFTFGVIAWFILVIETMVAAPLVAFGLTHPQGHDFLGKIEQSLMLLLGVFLRPVLMVIGLFAAMILSYIAFRMTNFGFASFMSDIFTSTPVAFNGNNSPSPMAGMHAFFYNGSGPASVGKLAMLLIGMPVLLMMYSTAVVMIVNQCYSLIYKLPDYIMRWIGAPSSESGIAGMMQDIKGSVEGASKAVGGGAAETTGETIKGVEDLAKQGVKGLRKKGGGSTTSAPSGGA